MKWKKIIADQISKVLISIICKEPQLNKKKIIIDNNTTFYSQR